MTAAIVSEVFGLVCEVVPDPVSNTPLVVPRGRYHAAAANDHRQSPISAI